MYFRMGIRKIKNGWLVSFFILGEGEEIYYANTFEEAWNIVEEYVWAKRREIEKPEKEYEILKGE